MSWKKRVQEIARRNPAAMHPLLTAKRERVWDRASWHKDSAVVHPDRPIVITLRWLAKQGQLTPAGFEALRAFEAAPEEAQIVQSYVTPKAALFLDSHYEEWYSTAGINAAIDSNVALDDELWTKMWSTQK